MLWLRSKIVLTGLALVAALVIIFLLFGKTNVAAEDYANLMGQVSSAEFSSRKSAFLVQYEAQQHKVVEEAEEVVKNYTSGVNPWKKSTVDTYVKKRGIEYKWSEKQVGNANIVYNVLMDEANRNAIIAKVKGTSVLSKDDYLNYKIFICAVIGNICGEGTAGMLEGYTDTYWHGYVSKWKADTGKSLTSKQQAEVMSVYNTVSAWAKKSSGETRYIDTPSEVDTMLQLGSFNGIGVGMVQ